MKGSGDRVIGAHQHPRLWSQRVACLGQNLARMLVKASPVHPLRKHDHRIRVDCHEHHRRAGRPRDRRTEGGGVKTLGVAVYPDGDPVDHLRGQGRPLRRIRGVRIWMIVLGRCRHCLLLMPTAG